MKKILVLLILTFSLNLFGQDAPKWRTLTISSVVGTDYSNLTFIQPTASLFYELENNWAITSWNAVNYATNDNIWVASQNLITKKEGNWRYGMGVQYGMGGNLLPAIPNTQSTFFVTQISYRFKLK